LHSIKGGLACLAASRASHFQRRGTLKNQDSKSGQMTHILSVDVEDYFQVEAFAGSVSRDSWNQWPSRVVANTQRVLDLFDQYNAKATFFFVGWVAEHFPHLVREVQSRGHELACHSYWHRTVYSLSPDEFRTDTRQAKKVIEDAAGVEVRGYRAPSWSITKSCLWALDILAEEGFAYDSSIYPIHHDLYGVPGAKRFPYTHVCGNGMGLREFPPATLRVAGTNFPVAGGGSLRIFPSVFTEHAFRTFEKNYGERVVVYLHPWEVDPDQPRIHGPLKSRLRHYTSLRRMENKLSAILSRHKFQRFSDVLADEVPDGRALPNAACRTTEQEVAEHLEIATQQGRGNR
jgi:polysaccharide deacetylase family protein (PEP-CTERM system associated)